MPTYEYECKSCNHKFDVFQAISDEPVKICPKCGKEVRRLINGGMGVIFKGHGFYITDKNSDGSSRGLTPEPSKDLHHNHTETAPCPGCAAADSCPKAVNS
ncbi:MAG: zinc ribbon domain-containing protein [Treponema sp.]|nr:zinc ribbon domain-containing protein [Treponema sp.]